VKQPIVLYNGPSWLDGAPIVCVATLRSTNRKTGEMIQTWVMRADVGPLDASKLALDASVCGQCPRRWSLGGDCYVNLGQASRSVWAHWERSGCPNANWAQHVDALRQGARHGFRMGSYGDPWAVPFQVWRDVLAALEPPTHTGYTHQWRRGSDDPEHVAWLRAHVMASVDSPSEALQARSLGWRYFLAVAPDVTPPARTVLCLAERDVNARACQECGMCNGAGGPNGARVASVYLVEHGSRSQGKHKERRSDALAVIQ
jgi:hypothetical protein